MKNDFEEIEDQESEIVNHYIYIGQSISKETLKEQINEKSRWDGRTSLVFFVL